ncbi:hypothetical protein NXV57_14975 [Bacteroides thetaiotaomicron]|nr:hypothetical protein [Bacteroides thetaiotaomicron]
METEYDILAAFQVRGLRALSHKMMLSVVISIFVLKERSCSTSGWSKVSRSLFRFVAWRAADMNMAAMSAIICCKLLFTILFARMVMCKRNKKSEDWQAIFTLFYRIIFF